MFDPAHLSFSGMLQREDGAVLIIRRLFPTLKSPTWAHTFSGAPRVAEPLLDAVRRCAERELDIDASAAVAVLLARGQHPSADGRTAGLHPAYLLKSGETPRLDEKRERCWVDPMDLGRQARANPAHFSPLLALHAERLPFYGGSARRLPDAVLLEEQAAG